ncbi:MAG: HD domain-containing protein [archaeon]
MICFMERIKKKFNGEDLVKIEHALEIAEKAHEGQKRKNGDAFLTHPISTGEILLDMDADAHTVCAGLLHDTVEDTELSLKEIEEQFSRDICRLIKAVTKFKVFSSNELNSINYNNKIKDAGEHDTRVFLIKLADRLHNTRTIDALPKEKKEKMFKENKEFFIPLARKLGFGDIANELESIS